MKRIIFKEKDKWYFSQYPQLRNLPLDIEPKLNTDLADSANKGFSILEHDGDYTIPVSHRIFVYKKENGFLVFNDPILEIYEEPFMPSAEQSFNLTDEEKQNGFWLELHSGENKKQLKRCNLIFEFQKKIKQSEDGVNYKNLANNKIAWFCSCFRCYFNFQTPPNFIGMVKRS